MLDDGQIDEAGRQEQNVSDKVGALVDRPPLGHAQQCERNQEPADEHDRVEFQEEEGHWCHYWVVGDRLHLLVVQQNWFHLKASQNVCQNLFINNFMKY